MIKIAIIGGSGFIGKNLSRYLCQKGLYIKVIDKYIDEIYFKKIDSQFDNIKLYKIDVCASDLLCEIVNDCDSIIWLIHNSVPSSIITLNEDYNINITPLTEFLEKLKKKNQKQNFIYISSGGAIYGNSIGRTPHKETDDISPISTYGLSKYIAEVYIRYILHESNIPYFILRPSNIYGPEQNFKKPQGIIGYAFKACLEQTELSLYNGGNIYRDFLHVDDFSKAIHVLITSNNVRNNHIHSIYNLGSNIPISMLDIVHKISAITNIELQFKLCPPRNCDVIFNVLDASKFSNDYNWYPNVSLDSGLQSVYNWINE